MRDAIDIMQKPFTKPGVRLYLVPGVYNSLVRSRVCSVSLVCLCLSLASCSTNGVLMECCETKKCKWDIWKYDSIGEAYNSQSLLYGHLSSLSLSPGADLGGGCRGCAPLPPEMTCGFLIQLVFCKKKQKTIIGVEVEQETSAPPPKENPGSAPVSLSLGKESPYIFSQFNPLNTDTVNGPSVSVLTGFDRIRFRWTAHLTTLPSPNPTLTLSFTWDNPLLTISSVSTNL